MIKRTAKMQITHMLDSVGSAGHVVAVTKIANTDV